MFSVALLPLALAACGSSAATDGSGSGSGGQSSGRNPDVLTVAQIPSENSTTLKEAREPLTKLLEKQTGKKIAFQNATSYAAVIEAMRAKKADIGFFGPDSYVTAKDTGVNLDVMAASVDTKNGSATYQSYAIVKADSPVKSLKDYRGKKVCFVDPNSTSGYLYPQAGLADAGIDTGKDIKTVMAGGHDASVLAVMNGQCDAGFADDSMINETLPQAGKLKKSDYRIVWKSKEIPDSPAAVAGDLDPALKQKIVDTFDTKANTDYMVAHGFCAKASDCLNGGSWGYKKVTDALYASVRKVCDITKKCTSAH
ncbi:phosphate-import protein PhnD [Streptomyces sp. TS71-3]|nr:phosphate-import protein PhnD [Streptomyces sp. TS71-3]